MEIHVCGENSLRIVASTYEWRDAGISEYLNFEAQGVSVDCLRNENPGFNEVETTITFSDAQERMKFVLMFKGQ